MCFTKMKWATYKVAPTTFDGDGEFFCLSRGIVARRSTLFGEKWLWQLANQKGDCFSRP